MGPEPQGIISSGSGHGSGPRQWLLAKLRHFATRVGCGVVAYAMLPLPPPAHGVGHCRGEEREAAKAG